MFLLACGFHQIQVNLERLNIFWPISQHHPTGVVINLYEITLFGQFFCIHDLVRFLKHSINWFVWQCLIVVFSKAVLSTLKPWSMRSVLAFLSTMILYAWSWNHLHHLRYLNPDRTRSSGQLSFAGVTIFFSAVLNSAVFSSWAWTISDLASLSLFTAVFGTLFVNL